MVSLAFILVVVDRHVAYDRFSRPAPRRSDMTFMSYNAPKEPDDERGRGQVTALIARFEPDLLALQESSVWAMKRTPDILRSHKKFSAVIDSLGYKASMPPQGGPPDGRWTHWKPAVLTRFEPDRQEQFDIESGVKEWPALSVSRTELTRDGRRMAVYNVHLTSHGAGKPWHRPGGVVSLRAWIDYLSEAKSGYQVRVWQVERIKYILADEQLPFVLLGDFNSTPDSWTYRQLSEGLQDAFRLTGAGWGGTYHARWPIVRIDFVLLGPEFEPVHAFVADPYPSSSDHRPLVARFRWR